MIRPDEKELAAITNVAKHNPEFLQWLSNWSNHELRQLPNVPSSIVQLAQGRCQVLTELHKLLQDSIDSKAQPRRGSQL